MKLKHLAAYAALTLVVALVFAGATGFFDPLHIFAGHAMAAHVAMATAGAGALPEAQLAELSQQLKTAAEDVKKQAEITQTELKNLGKVTEETKKSADDALIKHNELSGRMSEIEKLLAQRNTDSPKARQTPGQIVAASEELKDFIKSGARGKISVGVKAIISSLTTDADGSAGALLVPQRVGGIVAPPQRRMTIRDLMTPGRTSSNAIEYVKETGFTNAAATVSETAGNTKPQSNIKFDVVLQAVTTIAHWVLATKQILSDAPQLESYIDGRLRYGLQYVEENQLLNGGGTGTDLNGVYTQATAYSAPLNPTAAGNLTKIDVIRLAMLQAALAEFPSTGIVMNPIDWADIELTKTDQGAYLFANPQGGSDPRLWRLPVVETQAMSADTFLTGAFQLGSQIFDREDANVLVSTEDSDNFRKNLVTVLAEERLASAVYRPEAFIKGAFSTALASS